MKIATGLLLKQNLFEGVLSSESTTDEVDFSEKGKSQFIKQLEEVIKEDDFDVTIDIDEQEGIELQEEFSEINEKVTETGIVVEKKNDKETFSTVKESKKQDTDLAQMEEVMTKGMEFLTGIYAMSSGKKIENTAKPNVNVNRETGEVSITFKMDF